MKKIDPSDLVEICASKSAPMRIELAYALDDNLLFGERIYRADARFWLHESLARVVFKAAELAAAQDLRLVVYDGLRSVDAQARMLETQVVADNPHWLEAPRLLSPPGAGAHPRGMAVDCSLETLDGELLDMGCAFDFLADDPSPAVNVAHRDYAGHSANVMGNRRVLDGVMGLAADDCGVDLFPLPQEWWDFRLPEAIYEAYAPLNDGDLPRKMRMCGSSHSTSLFGRR